MRNDDNMRNLPLLNPSKSKNHWFKIEFGTLPSLVLPREREISGTMPAISRVADPDSNCPVPDPTFEKNVLTFY